MLEQVKKEIARQPSKLVTPGEYVKSQGGLLVPKPQEKPQFTVIRGRGSHRQVAEELEKHGNFEELRKFSGKASTSDNIARSVPKSMRNRAVDLAPRGADRRVYEHETAPPPQNLQERVDRVLDTFFISGNVAGGNKLVRSEGQPPVKSRSANEVYDNSGHVYGFYKSVMGRFSIDDKGMPLSSVVHQHDLTHNGDVSRLENAYYRHDDNFMRYGDGKNYRYTSLSVAGHELTHGVTHHTAGLVYRGQSGALNEHFSDVMAVAINHWKQGVTVDKADWRIGADAIKFTAPKGTQPIRSMSNPNSVHDQPGHMSQYVHTKEDNGGVHINSGIPNRAFYGAAMRIGGHVSDKAAKIWYVTLRDYLRSDANFNDAARLTVHVAGNMYGAGSREQKAVIAGWRDVGIHVNPNGPLPPARDVTKQAFMRQQEPAGAKPELPTGPRR